MSKYYLHSFGDRNKGRRTDLVGDKKAPRLKLSIDGDGIGRGSSASAPLARAPRGGRPGVLRSGRLWTYCPKGDCCGVCGGNSRRARRQC